MIGRRALAAMGGALALAACSGERTGSGANRSARARSARTGSASYLPLYTALDEIARGIRSAPVTVLQIGDSHTANDAFSNRMRQLFQDRFGNAGRGMVPPGIPFRYYRPAQLQVTASGWDAISSFSRDPSGPFGLAGLRQHAAGPAQIELTATEPGGLAQLTIEALGQPGGGSFVVEHDGTGPTARFATSSDQPRALWCSVDPGKQATRAVLTTQDDGPVDLLGCVLRSLQPGVSYANLGTIGATVRLVNLWDAGLMAQEMAQLRPALILLAFGTNEGFDDGADPAAYARDYADALQRLRIAAPEAGLVLMGAPDGVRRAGHQAAGAICQGGDPRHPFISPPKLAALRAVQRDIAAREGLAFFDWSAAMGGRCSMVEWAAAEPPLAAADHVHLLTAGYRSTAEALFADIMRGYDATSGPAA
jgi:lysophospholipase L1-like esterase